MTSEYAALLDGVLSSNSRQTEIDRRVYLESLAQATQTLWQAYRTRDGGGVVVDYSSKAAQEAYLLRYYLPNSFLLDEVLRKAKATILNRGGEVVSCFFGGGPGPELLGLMRHLKRGDDESRRLVSWIFDVASAGWAYGRDIVERSILSHAWPYQQFELNPQKVDVGSPRMLENCAVVERLGSANIVVFQNCLNEVASTYAPEQMRRVADLLAAGSTMVVIDRDGYDIKDKLRPLADWATNEGVYEMKCCIDTFELFDGNAIKREILQTEARHLFGDTDLHRARNLQLATGVKYRWVSITKGRAASNL
jgi:hypothetical protein